MIRSLSWLPGILVFTVIFVVAAFALKSNSASPAKRKAVVVELFTSEGCSSCPPADAVLTRLGHEQSTNGAEIIALGFHVDYWNYLGWKDRFSSHTFTERQERYAARFHEGPYTPQLIVDGESQLVGSDSYGAESAISEAAARQPQCDVQISWAGPDKALVAATSTGGSASGQVVMAITEDDLTTHVGAGENGGRLLHHSAVVRDFRVLGDLAQGRLQMEVPIKMASDWNIKGMRLAVFVQNAPLGPIEGAASIPFQQ